MDADAGDHTADGAVRARRVGQKTLPDRQEEPNQLPEPDIERRAMIVVELVGVERDEVIDERARALVVGPSDGDERGCELFPAHLVEEVELVRAPVSIAGEKADDERLA